MLLLKGLPAATNRSSEKPKKKKQPKNKTKRCPVNGHDCDWEQCYCRYDCDLNPCVRKCVQTVLIEHFSHSCILLHLFSCVLTLSANFPHEFKLMGAKSTKPQKNVTHLTVIHKTCDFPSNLCRWESHTLSLMQCNVVGAELMKEKIPLNN